MFSNTSRRSLGFTIVEVIVAISVVAILAGISIVGYGAWQTQIAHNAIKNDLNALAGAMEAARNFGDGYPTSIPPSFTASDNVQSVTIATSSSGDYYCASATSTNNITEVFKISSDNSEVTNGACPDYTGVVVGNGLLGWWKLNQNANDSSGNGNTGTATNGTIVTGANGQTNGAYSFSTPYSRINVPMTSFPDQLNALTVSFWARPTTALSSSVIVANPDIGTNRLNIHLPWSDNLIYWDFGLCCSEGRLSTPFNSSWFNSWAHWVFTVDPLSGMKIYRNNVLIASNNDHSVFAKGSQTIDFGYLHGNTTSWQGSLDDVRFYKRALQKSDISLLYSAGAQ